jgi:predicted TIM-barrel fold metal-dependent hydrolase
MAVIAIEEHFTSPQLRKLIAPREGPIQAMLDNMSTRLIKDMDEGGIDIAVLSENNPAAHNLDPETSVTMAKASNDFLHAQIQANPTRFKGFAALPLPDPKAAADELERGVTKLGLLGAMIHGHDQGSVRRRQEILAGVRARHEARRAGLHPSLPGEARSRGGVLQGSRRRAAGLAARLRS